MKDGEDKVARIFDDAMGLLSEHIRRSENEAVESRRIRNIITRPFSTVIVFEIQVAREKRVLAMKTTTHHPEIRSLTERENQAVVEYDILMRLYPLYRQVNHCSVPRPVLVIPELESFVMGYVEGALLLDRLRYARYLSQPKEFRTLREQYVHCGRWLRKFQEFTGIVPAGPGAVSGLLERCGERLDFIEERGDRRIPGDLKNRVMGYLHDQASGLRVGEVPVSGRHGDFGPWNMIVNADGITLIDFLGFRNDLLPVDLLKMQMCFEDQGKYLACSGRRIRALRDGFLEGYGTVPDVPMPAVNICEAYHRVCSVMACVANPRGRLHRRIERNLTLESHLRWLTDDRRKSLLWPSGN